MIHLAFHVPISSYTKLTGLEVFYVGVSIVRHGNLALHIALIAYYTTLT